MRNLLTKHGIPADSLPGAVDFISAASEDAVLAFNAEFGITMTGHDAFTAARFAVDGIYRGAAAVDKVVGYVAKRMTGAPEKAVQKPVTVVMAGAPVVDTPDVTVAPVVAVTESDGRTEAVPVIKVKGRRGRKRLGNSDFCKAVAALGALPATADRKTMLDCLVSKGIKRTSAVVYLWRYNNGERE